MKASCDAEGVAEYGGLRNVERSAWDSLQQPILTDSGASTSVLPLKCCTRMRTEYFIRCRVQNIIVDELSTCSRNAIRVGMLELLTLTNGLEDDDASVTLS